MAPKIIFINEGRSHVCRQVGTKDEGRKYSIIPRPSERSERSSIVSRSFIWFFILLCSCSKPLYKDTFLISGTFLEVVSPYKEVSAIVYGEFKRLDQIFNMYDPDSEVSRLNKTYGKEFVASDELLEVLYLSQRVYDMTGGAFDVSCGRLYSAWKKIISEAVLEKFPDSSKIENLKSLCGMDYVSVDTEEKTVLIKKKGLKIDLSGIAKGYMVDKARDLLREKGIDSALINAGGDIYCLGRSRQRLWRVGIQDPKNLRAIVERRGLKDAAIATSGGYEQFFEYRGSKFSHLVDPHTGFPVRNNILSVSVISESCALADSFATAFCIMGADKIKDFFAENNLGIEAVVLMADGAKKYKHYYE